MKNGCRGLHQYTTKSAHLQNSALENKKMKILLWLMDWETPAKKQFIQTLKKRTVEAKQKIYKQINQYYENMQKTPLHKNIPKNKSNTKGIWKVLNSVV